MVDLFESNDYKKYIKERVQRMPGGGRGELGRIAKSLGVNNTMVSQVLGGQKDFSLEQALKLCEHFSMTELETEYFLDLVQFQRAGTTELKKMFEARLEQHRNKSANLADRLAHDKPFTDEAQAVYYSNWIYIAIYVASSIEGLDSVEDISEYLSIPRKQVAEAINFLLEYGIVVRENDKLDVGTQRTHLGADSLLISTHHTNWRQKSIEKSGDVSKDELMFSAPVSLSEKDFKLLRKKMLQFIEDFSATIKSSPAETVACFNLDFYKMSKAQN